MSKVECHLEFSYGSSEQAERVLRAVELENYPYVDARIEGAVLISNTSADSLNSLVHTLEDFLSCVSLAESMLEER